MSQVTDTTDHDDRLDDGRARAGSLECRRRERGSPPFVRDRHDHPERIPECFLSDMATAESLVDDCAPDHVIAANVAIENLFDLHGRCAHFGVPDHQSAVHPAIVARARVGDDRSAIRDNQKRVTIAAVRTGRIA